MFFALSQVLFAAAVRDIHESSLPEGPGVRRLQSETCQNISFTKHEITTSALGVESVQIVDLDGDGHSDIIAALYDEDTISWFRNDGSSQPTFTRNDITNTAVGVWEVYAADVNGDGFIDILSADSAVAWYENNGVNPPTLLEESSKKYPLNINTAAFMPQIWMVTMISILSRVFTKKVRLHGTKMTEPRRRLSQGPTFPQTM